MPEQNHPSLGPEFAALNDADEDLVAARLRRYPDAVDDLGVVIRSSNYGFPGEAHDPTTCTWCNRAASPA